MMLSDKSIAISVNNELLEIIIITTINIILLLVFLLFYIIKIY